MVKFSVINRIDYREARFGGERRGSSFGGGGVRLLVTFVPMDFISGPNILLKGRARG